MIAVELWALATNSSNIEDRFVRTVQMPTSRSGVSRGVSGCPETPPDHDFFKSGGDTVTGTDPYALPDTYICDVRKPPLIPTLDTLLFRPILWRLCSYVVPNHVNCCTNDVAWHELPGNLTEARRRGTLDNKVRCVSAIFSKECYQNIKVKVKGKGMVLYSAVSSPLDRSKRFTLSSPGRPVHSDTVLGFSWKHSSHAAIAQRLFTHISTTVYSQVLIYTAESTEASWSERKCPNF